MFLNRVTLCSLLWLPLTAHCHSSVAHVPGKPVGTIYAAWSYPTVREADEAAVKGCQSEARKNRIATQKRSCTVFHRQAVPGAGAIICGAKGCSVSSGFSSKDEAMVSAYRQCERDGFKDCQRTGITTWVDEAEYRGATSNLQVEKGCAPAAGKTLRSTYRCQNGDCLRTFENGCTVRFQAPFCFDTLKSTWEWKPDGC